MTNGDTGQAGREKRWEGPKLPGAVFNSSPVAQELDLRKVGWTAPTNGSAAVTPDKLNCCTRATNGAVFEARSYFMEISSAGTIAVEQQRCAW